MKKTKIFITKYIDDKPIPLDESDLENIYKLAYEVMDLKEVTTN